MDFKVYIPKEIKKPLIWFLIASVIGIIIQSSNAGHFVFIDFFGKNYLYVIKTIGDGFVTSALLLGFFNTILLLLEVFYYIIMTISLIIIIYHLIATFNKKNTKKIVLYLVIIIGIIVLINYSGLIFSAVNDYSCPTEIIPQNISLDQNLLPFSTQIGNLNPVNKALIYTEEASSSWEDGQPMNLYNKGYLCHKGNKEGENVNLVYCDGLLYSKTNTTTAISENGTVGATTTKKISYKINLVLQSYDDRDLISNPSAHTYDLTKENNYLPEISLPSAFSIQGVTHITYYKVISSECMKQ